MKVYSVLEALTFLKESYGGENMPTCEETLRRAIRVGDLKAQETGDPGRKGYTITEDDLRAYAENRLNRMRKRRPVSVPDGGTVARAAKEEALLKFPEIYRDYINGDLAERQYFLALHSEKSKWEARIKQYKEQLAKIEMERLRLENEIQDCQSTIEAFENGIQIMGK